jgi:hypothetical protein
MILERIQGEGCERSAFDDGRISGACGAHTGDRAGIPADDRDCWRVPLLYRVVRRWEEAA